MEIHCPAISIPPRFHTMKYRTLGKTGWDISAVSMGCWGIGGQWGPIDDRQGTETIHAALDAGVNLFDTADSYGMGRSEELIGMAFGSCKPKDAYVATKVGNWANRQGDRPGFNSIYSIIGCCHASLYRLGFEPIDLYQCHHGIPENPELFVEAFELLKTQGKIREYAISTDHLPSLQAMNASGQCASCQINYSILDRSAEKEILPYCFENNIGVLLRGPLRKGLLTGKFNAETKFDEQPREPWNQGPGREEFLRELAIVERLRTLASADRSMVEIALQFTLVNPAVTCPIPGMKSPEQARANAAAADGKLSREELVFIDELTTN